MPLINPASFARTTAGAGCLTLAPAIALDHVFLGRVLVTKRAAGGARGGIVARWPEPLVLSQAIDEALHRRSRRPVRVSRLRHAEQSSSAGCRAVLQPTKATDDFGTGRRCAYAVGLLQPLLQHLVRDESPGILLCLDECPFTVARRRPRLLVVDQGIALPGRLAVPERGQRLRVLALLAGLSGVMLCFTSAPRIMPI
jgi:hypothetical protein